MNKERELLERVVTAFEDDRYELIDAMEPVINEIRDYYTEEPTCETPKINGFYRHYKGGVYQVIGMCKLESTQEMMVIYLGEKDFWVRPLSEWFSKFTKIELSKV